MKIKLYFILAEENLFHPNYFLGIIKFINHKKYDISGVSIVKEKHNKGFLYFICQQSNLWGLKGFFIIGILSTLIKIVDILGYKDLSVRSICKTYSIPYYQTNNVNSINHIQYLKEKSIDIIVSSNGQIFKDELLKLPKICCINRHTALLPRYGGVLPVFWAMYFNEKQYGVSIHYMVEKIDQGDIIYQEVIPIKNNSSLFKNYIVGFHKSIFATIKSLNQIENKKTMCKFFPNDKQYFSFPSVDCLKKFRTNNKTIELGDVNTYLSYIKLDNTLRSL